MVLRYDATQQNDGLFRLIVEGVKEYAIFMLDPDGYVVTWNSGAERIKGYQPHEIIGQHFSRFYPAEALERGFPQEELKLAVEQGRYEDEGWRVRKDGSLFWANVIITPVWVGAELRGFSKVTRDLTERKRQEESLKQSEERFRLLIEGVKDYAIFMLDPNGYVSTWNTGAERIKGYRAQDILGRHFSSFYTPEAIARNWPEQELVRALEQGRCEDEGWRVRKDGSRFWANVVITPLYDTEGSLRGFAKVTRDMTQRKQAEALEELSAQREQLLDAERAARAEAERAARMKDEFLATLSHELRTPLNAILGWAQVLRHDPSLSADTLRGLDAIDRNARAQTQLIEDLLDVSRIITGRVRLDVQRVVLADVVLAAIDSVQPTAETKDVRLEKIIDPLAGPVSGDAARLQQVVWNLLTNAIKFTPKSGKVQVTLERVDSHLELSVSDTGIGISPDFLPYVFDRFSQVDGSPSRRHGGLGLGLSIVKQLVELHGGTVRAKSAGEGAGATFIINLPLSLARARDIDFDRLHPTQSPSAQLPKQVPDLTGVTVLVVDDELDARELIQRVLQERGATVTITDSAAEALRIVDAARPDVLLSDIGMPGMDGYQLIRRIRSSEQKSARLPAAALTAFARSEDRQKAILAGYQSHIAKPLDIGELVIVVASLAGRIGGD